MSWLFILSAFAYEVDPIVPAGTAATFKLRTPDFTQDERDVIEAAIEAFNAGFSGDTLQGASWQTNVIPSTASMAYKDGENGIFKMSQTDLHELFEPPQGSIVFGILYPVESNYTVVEMDLIINADVTFCLDVPSRCSSQQKSLGQLVTHEIGHILLDHENSVIATMNERYPFGGDVGGYAYGVHEDDAAGWMAAKPSTSTGVNLTVGAFEQDPTEPSEAIPLWDDTKIYDLSTAGWDNNDPPDLPQLIHQGPGSTSALFWWMLSTDADCNLSDPAVGYRHPTMVTNVPYRQGPYGWNFSGIQPGYYYLCVRADPLNSVTETNESDNTVVSPTASIKVIQ